MLSLLKFNHTQQVTFEEGSSADDTIAPENTTENGSQENNSSFKNKGLYKKNTGESSLFSAGIVINGSVHSESDIVVKGEINGDLACKGDVFIEGTINGDISGVNVVCNSGKVNGNIAAQSDLSLYKQTVVVGDVKAATVNIEGSVVGNVTAEGNVRLKNTATVEGGISSGSIEVMQGAKIKGVVRVGDMPEK